MFKPLLAEKADLSAVHYPVFASPKYDGFRCIIDAGGNAVSRNLKQIANTYVAGKLREMKLPRFDGELLTYTGDKLDDFNTVQSKLSTRSGMPEFRYMVFDHHQYPNHAFIDRLEYIEDYFEANKVDTRIQKVKQVVLENEEQLLDYEAECLRDGWEGIMIRSFSGLYKHGRSTVREGILLKVKRFFDDEAEVISMHELMHNANEQTTNALGQSVRSSHKENMVGKGMLGKFTVRWISSGVEFDVGTGFNESQRVTYWNDESLIGRKITFKYQSVTPAGKPRFPVFLGFRND
jgi:DNA ligase-1